MIVDILWFADFPWIGIWARNSALLRLFLRFFFAKPTFGPSWLQLHHPTSYYAHTLRYTKKVEFLKLRLDCCILLPFSLGHGFQAKTLERKLGRLWWWLGAGWWSWGHLSHWQGDARRSWRHGIGKDELCRTQIFSCINVCIRKSRSSNPTVWT